jgi:hypothetical protein
MQQNAARRKDVARPSLAPTRPAGHTAGMRKLFPADLLMWAISALLAFIAIGFWGNFWTSCRLMWKYNAPLHREDVVMGVLVITPLAWGAGWMVCFLMSRLRVRLSGQIDKGLSDDYDEAPR